MRLRKARVVGTRNAITMHGPIKQKVYPKNLRNEIFIRLANVLGSSVSATAAAINVDPIAVYGIKQGRLTFGSEKSFLNALGKLLERPEAMQEQTRKRLWAAMAVVTGPDFPTLTSNYSSTPTLTDGPIPKS